MTDTIKETITYLDGLICDLMTGDLCLYPDDDIPMIQKAIKTIKDLERDNKGLRKQNHKHKAKIRFCQTEVGELWDKIAELTTKKERD